MSSFGAYGKVNEAEQERIQARRRTRKRVIIISISSIVLVAIVIAAVLGATLGPNGKSKSQNSTNSQSISSSIKAICKVTLYPDSCYTSLSSAATSQQLKPEDIFKLSIQIAMGEVKRASDSLAKNGFGGLITDNTTKTALNNCFDLLSLSLDHLNDTLYASSTDVTLLQAVDDLKTWLSAAGTYQETCIDGFETAAEGIKTVISENLKNSKEFTSNSLAIVTGISDIVSSFKLRRLMSYETETDCNDESPKWLSSKDRKLLQLPNTKIKVDAVVAKDGSGDYKTIKAALKNVPENSKERYVIYVKKGVYVENVRVEKKTWNLMMIGDGMNATVVTGSLNFVDETPTFSTATFATFGKGFIARDMAFVNTAGAAKHQAVALMVSSDETVFYRCRIDAFQDSLYAHSQRQFFRECNIYGTVDFIFGNAAVIIQNSTIRPKVPMVGQQVTITAQGKTDPNQNTGIVIHNCDISPGGDLKSVKCYLGRPWKTYSTTIIMRSMLASFIDPTGWLPWNATAPTDKIFYSEYQNFGPGSSTKNRVKWKGVKNNLSSKEVNKFTVNSFINGESWISNSQENIPYSSKI